MKHLTEPALPNPLPRPLSDPLRRYRWIVIIALALMVVRLLLPDVSKVRAVAAGDMIPSDVQQTLSQLRTADIASDVASFAILLCILLLLPRRATNALYLRSFRNDATTGALRISAQAALGPVFRLSGIRDPRRRWPALIRHLLYIFFLIRYAQPRFMNLEAGRDWKARLWRSLGEARCALIDVSELTPFVREEIDLAIRCLGFDRVLFIGDDSRTADEWRQVILTAQPATRVTALESPDVPPESIQLAVWTDTAAGRATFRDQVRAFADRLPTRAPGLAAAAFPETASSADVDGAPVTDESWRTFWLANLIGLGIAGALIWAAMNTPDAGLLWFLPAVIFHVLAILLLVQYLVVCGSQRQRWGIGATLLFAIVLAGPPLLREFTAPPADGSTSGIEVGNDLGQFGEATRQFQEANPTKPGNPAQWQQHLPPYIEQDDLWKKSLEKYQVPAEN